MRAYTDVSSAILTLSAVSLVFYSTSSGVRVTWHRLFWLARPAACKTVWNALRVFKRMIASLFSGFVTEL